MQAASISIADGIEVALDETLRPCFAMAGAALLQNTRAHQGRERQRNETGSENGDNDGNGELAENSPKQPRHERERDEHRCK